MYTETSISANADGLLDAALRKIDDSLHTWEYNYQVMSVGRLQVAEQTDKHRLLAHI